MRHWIKPCHSDAANDNLEREIAGLLRRPEGRPSKKPLVE
jgi:hypothetical protein